MLANRSLNYWVTAIAAHASDMSAWLFMGFPAAIYTHGLPSAWIAVGLIGGMFLTWQFIATKLRIITEQYKSITLPSFFEHRYADTTKILRMTSSAVMIIFFIPYIASGLTGMGRVFESIFDINYHVGIIIGLSVAIFYLLIGGFIARAWNDFFQGIFLLITIMIVPIIAFFHIGGIQNIIQAAAIKHVPLSFIPSFSKTNLIAIANGIMWGAGYFGMPHIIVNFMALDNVDTMKKAKYVGMTWQIITLISATAIGLLGIAYFTTLANPELIFVVMVQELCTPLIAGIILCAIIAATITTIDTQILVVGSTLTHDFYQQHILSKSNNHTIWVFRISIVIVSILAYIIAARNSSTVMGLVTYAWSGLGSAFSPVLIASLYSTKITKQAALAGIVSGALTAGLWPLLDATVLPLIPGFIVSTCTLGIISWLTPGDIRA